MVAEWQRNIINHLYWCLSSTTANDGELIKAKWLSLDNHIHNVHRRHGKSFLNVHMVDWNDEIETRSGYKDVSKALYTYAPFKQLTCRYKTK